MIRVSLYKFWNCVVIFKVFWLDYHDITEGLLVK